MTAQRSLHHFDALLNPELALLSGVYAEETRRTQAARLQQGLQPHEEDAQSQAQGRSHRREGPLRHRCLPSRLARHLRAQAKGQQEAAGLLQDHQVRQARCCLPQL